MKSTKLAYILSLIIYVNIIKNVDSQNRIIGGVDANPYQYKFMAEIIDNSNGDFCGGSILNEKAILTSAHCVSQHPPHYYSVFVGSKFKGQGSKHSISEVLYHETYLSDLGFDHDIAVLAINPPITPDNFTSFTKLPILGPEYGNLCYAAGWGNLGNGTFPDRLQETMVRLIDPVTCQKIENYTTLVNVATHFCAGMSQGGKDSCQGDSGGPLVCLRAGGWVQVGITAFGMECGKAGQPGVYMNLSYFRGWVNRMLMKIV
ncbi:unnamed protein product [Caenorhabditis brenneri]